MSTTEIVQVVVGTFVFLVSAACVVSPLLFIIYMDRVKYHRSKK